MDDEQLRLQCLQIATQQGLRGEDARKEARRMFNQIKGRSDDYGEPVRDSIKAKIVGKDGDLPDYVKE